MFCSHTRQGCIAWTPSQPQTGICIPAGHIAALRLLEPLQSCLSRRPSAPVTLLSSRELAFNNRVCFRSSITSFSNASRADGWDSPTALPLPMLTPSLHHGGLCGPQPSAFCKDAGEQKNQYPCKAHREAGGSCMVPPISLTCPSSGCGGQNTL